jgi:hypothetical protein
LRFGYRLRRLRGTGGDLAYFSRKAIAAFGDRIDIRGRFRGPVVENGAQLADGTIDGVVVVKDLPIRPEKIADGFAGDHGAGVFDEDGEEAGYLGRHALRFAVAAEFASLRIEDEDRKSERFSFPGLHTIRDSETANMQILN